MTEEEALEAWKKILNSPPSLTEEEQRAWEEEQGTLDAAYEVCLQAASSAWEQAMQETPSPDLEPAFLAAMKAGMEAGFAAYVEMLGTGPLPEEEKTKKEALFAAALKAYGHLLRKSGLLQDVAKDPQYPSRMATGFLTGLQRGSTQLTRWSQKEQEQALAFRQEGRRAAEGEALKLAQTFQAAVEKHQTRPHLSLREWEALWGLHALLRRAGYPQRLVFTRAEYYAAAGAETSFHRGRKDVLGSDRQQLDEAIQALFEREQVLYCEWKDPQGKLVRGELHLHILTDWGKVEEVEEDIGEDRYFATFHQLALQQIRNQFVNLPPLRKVKEDLEGTGATGRGGGLVTDLELVLWLHAFPYNPNDGGCHVDWLNLAEKVGLGTMLARRQKKKARDRLILAYDRAVKAGYLLSYELDKKGGMGMVDRLVKNTAFLTGKVLPENLTRERE